MGTVRWKIKSLIVVTVFLHVPAGLAQVPVTLPKFDVASIRLNNTGGPYVFNGMKSPGTFSAENQTLRI